MNIIDRSRSKEKVNIESTHGHKIEIEKGAMEIKTDCNVKLIFNRTEDYYRFIANPVYYQGCEIKFINILRDPKAVLDTVDDAYYCKDRVYSVLTLEGAIFLMFDES